MSAERTYRLWRQAGVQVRRSKGESASSWLVRLSSSGPTVVVTSGALWPAA